MATYRQVYTTFWQDPFVITLTPEEKYFYLYLITNSKTTICGIYELPMKIAEVETGYNRETVEKLLKKFEFDYKKVIYSKTTSEVCIINWFKYNINKSPKVRIAIEESFKKVKNKELIQYLYGIDTVAFATVIVTDTVPVTDTVIDTGSEELESHSIEDKKTEDIFKKYADGDEALYTALIEFEKMRKKLKKPMTNYAKELLIKDLNKLEKEGNDKVHVINQSIMNSWQGVFPLKRGESNASNQKHDESKPKYNYESTRL